VAQHADQPELPYWVADDYLRATALVLLEWAWGRITAAPASATPRWQTAAHALHTWVLPEFDMRLAIVRERLATAAIAATAATAVTPQAKLACSA
jgi:hypothetical protein